MLAPKNCLNTLLLVCLLAFQSLQASAFSFFDDIHKSLQLVDSISKGFLGYKVVMGPVKFVEC